MATFRSTGYTAYNNAALYNSGATIKTVDFHETITAAENENGDVWILSGPHTCDEKIVGVIGATPAFTSATDNDFGFYKKNFDGTFTAIDKDILVDGADLSSALTYRELLRTLNTSLDTTKTIGDHLGLTSETMPDGGVYLALTMNTASSATTVQLNLQIQVANANVK